MVKPRETRENYTHARITSFTVLLMDNKVIFYSILSINFFSKINVSYVNIPLNIVYTVSLLILQTPDGIHQTVPLKPKDWKGRAHIADKVCRVVFPVAFILAVSIYLGIYSTRRNQNIEKLMKN